MERVPDTAVTLTIPVPEKGVDGEVHLPGSKSITHRGLVLGALARGTTRLIGASPADDCRRTAEALGHLGAGVAAADDGSVLEVSGWGEHQAVCSEIVEAGESGTTARFLLPLLALGEGTCELRGGPRLGQRPMEPLVAALQSLGVTIRRPEPRTTLPLVVEAAGVEGGAVRLDARQSSQFASALLMASPRFRRGMILTLAGGQSASRPYMEMTCSMMGHFGVTVEQEGGAVFRVPAGSRYSSRDLEIEGDASAASYFFAAAAICGGTVRCMPLAGVDSLQGDARFVSLLEKMGCRVRGGSGWVEVRGDGGPLRPLDVTMNSMPDLVPTLAVIALFADGRTLISGAGHVRWKESDRLGDLTRELRRLGGWVQETEDGLVIEGDGGARLSGATLETHEDHRLAMSFAVAGLRLPGTVIRNPGCVAKSHPAFFRDLFRLAGHSE